jgi:diaminopimelate decarboxylase
MIERAKRAYKEFVIGRLRREDAEARRDLPPQFSGLPPSLWGYEVATDGTLVIEGQRVPDLLARHGTPLYIVSTPWLRRTYQEFIGPFRKHYPQSRLATSYKTNPLPAVCAELHACGTDAEVISEFELWLAQQLGLSGERIIVNGPGKTRSMLERAVRGAVKVINIDGFEEIDVISGAAQGLGRVQSVGVRVVTSVGWSSQFGLPIATGDAMAAFERIKRTPGLEATGLHLHIGTGLKSVGLYLRAIREVIEFATALRERLGIELRCFDLGGGYGVPTVRGKEAWDDRMLSLGYPAREPLPALCPTPEDYARPIAALFEERMPAGQRPEIVLEPGRAITSAAQTLFLSVIATKDTFGVRRLILDGGKNITIPLGWETHKIFPVQRLNEAADRETNLYGPLCHPGDVIANHLALPALRVGEAIAIMDAGAYFIPNQMNFSNPRPAVVMVEQGKARVVRQRESFEDVVRLDGIGA